MNHNWKKANAAILAAMLTVGAWGYGPVTVQAAPVVTEIPKTSHEEKAIDGSFLSVTGFAEGKVNDRSEFVGDEEAYRKVSTEEEFLDALQDARGGEVKVIEICEDLYLGWNELSSEAKVYPMINQYDGADKLATAPLANPSFVESGVSCLELDGINGLTIFSKNGNAVHSCEFKLQAGVNDMVIRNLKFMDVWDWDDQRTKGFGSTGQLGTAKRTGWAYMKINGAKNVWVDHCDFGVALDGDVDIENGSSGLSITWCNIGDTDYSVGSMLYKTIEYMEELYQQNIDTKGKVGTFKIYQVMRDNHVSKEAIAKYMGYHKKCHLGGGGDSDSWWFDKQTENFLGEIDKSRTNANEYLRMTFAYNYWNNIGSRVPMLRGGVGHLFNCYTDNTALKEAGEAMSVKNAAGKNVSDQIKAINGQTHFLYRGMNALNGASVAADTCVYYNLNEPMIGAESDKEGYLKSGDSGMRAFGNVVGMNHSLIVNSKVTKTDGSEYTGSSWDNNGSNLLAGNYNWCVVKDEDGNIIDPGHHSINNWSWGPDRDDLPKDENGDAVLSYQYQTFPLESVVDNVRTYGGAGTIVLDEAGWLKTEYDASQPLTTVDKSVEIPIESIELSKKEATTIFMQEEFLQLDARVTPSYTTEKAKDYTWKSSDETVATVNECGLVIPKKTGKTTITVTTKNNKSASCEVTVANLPTKLTIKKPEQEIHVGDRFQLDCTTTPADVLDESLTWESQSQCIRLVDAEKGIFEAVAEGKSQAVRVTANAKGNRLADPISASLNLRILERVITPGDVVGDGDGVKLNDAQYVLKVALRILKEDELTDAQKAAADVVGNGDGIKLSDAQAILKRALRITVKFDQEK